MTVAATIKGGRNPQTGLKNQFGSILMRATFRRLQRSCWPPPLSQESGFFQTGSGLYGRLAHPLDAGRAQSRNPSRGSLILTGHGEPRRVHPGPVEHDVTADPVEEFLAGLFHCCSTFSSLRLAWFLFLIFFFSAPVWISTGVVRSAFARSASKKKTLPACVYIHPPNPRNRA